MKDQGLNGKNWTKSRFCELKTLYENNFKFVLYIDFLELRSDYTISNILTPTKCEQKKSTYKTKNIEIVRIVIHFQRRSFIS